MKKTFSLMALVAILGVTGLPLSSQAGQAEDNRIDRLEKLVLELQSKIQKMEEAKDDTDQSVSQLQAELQEMETEQGETAKPSKFSFGGYGEIHANITEGTDTSGNSNDQLDIHRLVGYIGYDFSDWIKFNMELELEHAFVAGDGDSGGEVELEQAYFDFLLHDKANIRIGRTLVPVGYLNIHHEPTQFNGVERPSFYNYIIPSTWWSDGVGLFGNLSDNVTYQASVIAGLDGSGFSSDGIRGGRLKERPSLNDPALALRADYFTDLSMLQDINSSLRLGLSYYYGGIDNGNKGKDPDVSGDLTIYEVDFKLRLNDLAFSGAVAYEEIDGAENLAAGVAEEIFGYYGEVAYHFWPQAWKTGRLAKADAVAFLRYDDIDTQFKMPPGQVENRAKQRQEWTVGLSFYPVPNLVVKADYQKKDSDAPEEPADSFNVGVGWQF